MKPFHHSFRAPAYATAALWMAMAVIFLLGGCAGTSRPKPLLPEKDKSRFEQQLAQLIGSIEARQKNAAAALSPVAVLPGSLKSEHQFTRLEEVVMERLAERLLENHEMISLSRQNWFAFREKRPLNFSYTRGYAPSDLRTLVLYVVDVAADNVMEDLRVTISAFNSDNRAIAGLAATERFDFTPGQPARMLYESAPSRLPFPEGLEENPYMSMDRLSFSLAGELADAYQTGITAGDTVAADREIRVLLYLQPRSGVDPRLAAAIGSNLQQAVVANRGFTCVVSSSDFGSMFEQIDFYRSQPQVFAIEDPALLAGTVFLMAEIFPHLSGDRVGVALRAVWRVDPLEDRSGSFITDNTAGTYLSGFTAKSYLKAACSEIPSGKSPRVSDRVSSGVGGSPAGQSSPKVTPSPSDGYSTVTDTPRTDLPVETCTLCFQGFPDPVSREIYPVLTRAPGLQSIRRTDDACGQDVPSIGYVLQCRSRQDSLSDWLEANLRVSGDRVVPFRVHSRADNVLILEYNGGFQ